MCHWSSLGEELQRVRVLPDLRCMVDVFNKEVHRLQQQIDDYVCPQLVLFDSDNAFPLQRSLCASQIEAFDDLLLSFYYMCSLKLNYPVFSGYPGYMELQQHVMGGSYSCNDVLALKINDVLHDFCM